MTDAHTFKQLDIDDDAEFAKAIELAGMIYEGQISIDEGLLVVDDPMSVAKVWAPEGTLNDDFSGPFAWLDAGDLYDYGSGGVSGIGFQGLSQYLARAGQVPYGTKKPAASSPAAAPAPASQHRGEMEFFSKPTDVSKFWPDDD